MGDPAVLHDALVEHLRTLTSVSVFDGTVPDALPADAAGRVYPYVVAWGAPGWVAEELRRLDGDAHGALEWRAPLTVAAGTTTWCLRAVHLIRTALEGHHLTPGAGPLREVEGTPPVGTDRDASPPRLYVPLTFRCQTT